MLVRIESRAGHGVGKPAWKQADEAADIWAFVFWQLGMDAWQQVEMSIGREGG